MSFLYPRTVSVRRPLGIALARPGVQAEYSGVVPEGEYAVADDLPASIQFKGFARAAGAAVPADTENRTNWDIFIPPRALARGVLLTRDILVDDAGARYQVVAAYWNSLGYRARCELLEA